MKTVKSTFFQIIQRKESSLFLILFISGITLYGWLFNKIALASFFLIYKPISPIVAVTFIALCILFLININFEKSLLTKSLVTLLIIIIAFLYSIIFLSYFFNFTLDIESIFVKNIDRFGNVLTGHMSPIASLLFVFICISILSIRQNNSRIIKYIGGSLSLLTCLASSVLLIGYLYKTPLLYGSYIIPVALPTAICFLLFSITLLRIYELQFWTFNLIKDNKVTFQLLKTFLPIIVFIVILQGFLDATFSFNDINPILSSVIVLIIVISITAVVVIRVSAILGSQMLRAEQELIQSEKKYRIIVENVGEGIGIVNANEDFVFVNHAAERIFGVGEGELPGKNLTEFINEEQYISILNQTKIREKAQSSIYEIELTLPDSIKRNILITAVPQFDDNEKFIGTFGIFRDITEIKNYEKQLLQLNADKDRFISILGHDLRNPFNALLGLSELLTKNIRKYDIDEIENIVNHIKNLSQNTYILLEDLLMWARAESGKIPFEPQKLNFTDICKDILRILNPNAVAKNITINYFAADGINIFADIDMFKAILRNLVSNAIKFTNKNGAININAEENSGNVTISVSDNGIGIKPDNLARLFDISQVLTTKGTAEETGTGLGLVLCKEFVEKHEGKIWVESEYGRGTRFYFTIPCNTDPKEINVVSDVAGDNQIKNLKILIAEDDKTARIVLAKMVGMFGKEILYAKTGVEAVVACKNNPDIDLILMDIQMPEMDGYEATRQIRQFNKEVIIIIQTAYDILDENEKEKEIGHNDYIRKPINYTLLKELIKKWFNK